MALQFRLQIANHHLTSIVFIFDWHIGVLIIEKKPKSSRKYKTNVFVFLNPDITGICKLLTHNISII